MSPSTPGTSAPQASACILCSRNCGIEVAVEDGHLRQVRGNPRHPISTGYLCQKATRLDHYQNGSDRLDGPLRRRPDGSFAAVSWDEAIADIARRSAALRKAHGGHAFAYYGGGGQGNHLGGMYGAGLRAALGTPYYYSALAQEKTGDFWVNGRLFGRQSCHTAEEIEHAEVALFIGTNPWQAHGIRNARQVLKELASDPDRTLIVIDPRATETALMAQIHLQLRPGTDAYLLAAMLAMLVNEDWVDAAFLQRHTIGFPEVRAALARVPIASCIAIADVDPALVERATRRFAQARSACVRVDLGIQQSLHSTLNSYLEKLLFLLTGNFGKAGANNLHSFLAPLIGHSPEGPGAVRTKVTGMAEISRIFPPNVLPLEIASDHPDRVRALFVDSANPLVSGADTRAYQEALQRLELLVVIDVAMTETARLAHYVLPASSQFEKWEATFFTLDFPRNGFHLRRPLLPPRPGTLPEPEIYRRLLVALGALPARFPLLRRIAALHRRWPRGKLLQRALLAHLATRPRHRALAPMILYQTLGQVLPDGAAAAAPLWAASHMYAARHAAAVRRAGIAGTGAALGEALFARILSGRDGVLISEHRHEDTFSFIRHPGHKIHLCIPELLTELARLPVDGPGKLRNDEYPLVLIAGERRSYNANTIYRDPRWRRNDQAGALHIHPEDARALGLSGGDRALCESPWGRVEVTVELSDNMRRGVVGAPHGYGMSYPDASGQPVAHGPNINLLTGLAHCDPIARTPLHKNVPVRLRALDRESASH
jgi:anaerobic selenocysteine-containing dehydrogenase